MAREFVVELKSWGASDGATCCVCGDFTKLVAYLGTEDMSRHGVPFNLCDKKECLDWQLDKYADELVERHRDHRARAAEKWDNNREGK